jgi:biotin carboxylase
MDTVTDPIILLMPSLTYRANAFLEAAERLGLTVIRGLDMPAPLARYWHPTLPLDFRAPDRAVRDLVRYARAHPVAAIVAVDDAATVIAARACAALGLSHNAPEAAAAARDKYLLRLALARAGVPGARFQVCHTDDDPEAVAATITYPCVVKPTCLSGSQGVIRADDRAQFVEAFRRSRAIVLATGGDPGIGGASRLLVEEYIPGEEVVLEGLLAQGELHVLALFDKPDPLVGPFFEETIYTTPSRLPESTQRAIGQCCEAACAALGLREGPIHAEFRVNENGPWVIEVAARSIGGLCSRILRFGAGDTSLEELILAHAVGRTPLYERERRAGGVMMIPIPAEGVLRAVEGLEEARAVPNIESIEITAPLKHRLVPLPEGSSYLGFIFARADRAEEAEAALRAAHRRLHFVIAPHYQLASHTANRR